MDITLLLCDFIYDVIQEYPDTILHNKPSYINMCELVMEEKSLMFNIFSLDIIDPSIVCDYIERTDSTKYTSPYYQCPYVIFNNLNDVLYFMKDFLEYIEHPESVNISKALRIMEAWVDMDNLCEDLSSICVTRQASM